MKGSVADTRGGGWGRALARPNNFSKPLNDSWLTVKQSHIKDFMINKSLIGYILSKFAWNLGGGGGGEDEIYSNEWVVISWQHRFAPQLFCEVSATAYNWLLES